MTTSETTVTRTDWVPAAELTEDRDAVKAMTQTAIDHRTTASNALNRATRLYEQLAASQNALRSLGQAYADLKTDNDELAAENARVRQQRDEALSQDTEPQYLVWSHKQRAWWGPGAGGYRQDVTGAGRFPLAKAHEHASTRSWPADHKTPPEVVIPAPPADTLADPNRISEYVEVHIKAATDAKIAARHAAADAEATR